MKSLNHICPCTLFALPLDKRQCCIKKQYMFVENKNKVVDSIFIA